MNVNVFVSLSRLKYLIVYHEILIFFFYINKVPIRQRKKFLD